MLFITSVELSCLGQRMQECGMQWEAVMRRLGRRLKLKNVMKGHSAQRIDKVLLSTKWLNYTTQWDHNSS